MVQDLSSPPSLPPLDFSSEDENKAKLQLWYHPYSDILARLRALGAFAFARKQLLENETMSAKQNKKGKSWKGKGKKELESPLPSSEKDETYKLCEQLGLHHVCRTILLPWLTHLPHSPLLASPKDNDDEMLGAAEAVVSIVPQQLQEVEEESPSDSRRVFEYFSTTRLSRGVGITSSEFFYSPTCL
jgi:hypothetical protein